MLKPATTISTSPPGLRQRLTYAWQHSRLAYLAYRYRYLACFAVIGWVSILLELALLRYVFGLLAPRPVAGGLAFLLGMMFSFVANALFNFRVPWPYLLRTFYWFAAISALSFALNMAAIACLGTWDEDSFGTLRLTSAGLLFMLGYSLHRRYTFDQARSFGLAVYATSTEDVALLHERLGQNLDHIHIDLIDNTMTANPAPIDLAKLDQARGYWPRIPIAMHIMSRTPRRWMDATWSLVDWYLIHVEAEDDPWETIAACRVHQKKVGFVWRPGIALSSLWPYLGHLDFVMVLGIREPGRSGQTLCPEALETATVLDKLRKRYGFRLMFDGGVTTTNVDRIPAQFIVAASAITRAEQPIAAAHVLRSAGRYERRIDSKSSTSEPLPPRDRT